MLPHFLTLNTTLSAEQLLGLIRDHAPGETAEVTHVEVAVVGELLGDLEVHVNVPARITTLDRELGPGGPDDTQTVRRAGRVWHEHSWFSSGDAAAVARYAGGDA
ncbi:hypothetical protein [Deinococcus soli (ex Cha et al. 2016)]|uniref:Uncharacterized protein n=2 Tax=Deinococcus soli (ex Cha et al. 2016) TaxID=1309411 RepID=A0ACC6KFI9_9DEIO|nr:hypothetical protein [Deinococcus soli (ex Cha et al. 2016)]MDR6218329.1 hypothetical protein [Deinococcus soli (ex Cha et al. 2016)]MDR6329069.1 hypothetical protein [Deinococcus soli (ex Cha et al. 2016)]MDR6751342.1 hypothetical protein [Deinococcus soli (ex Cha et al. 2016)]